MTELIYKIFRVAEWEEAEKAGHFAGSPDDLRDGFVHFSAPHQVRTTCDKHFWIEDNIMLAAVDISRLGAALKWEVSRGGDRFPHLYGTLPLAAVRSVVALRRGPDGRLIFPPDIP